MQELQRKPLQCRANKLITTHGGSGVSLLIWFNVSDTPLPRDFLRAVIPVVEEKQERWELRSRCAGRSGWLGEDCSGRERAGGDQGRARRAAPTTAAV